MSTIIDALTAAGPWPTAAIGGAASIIGGSLGGWISTALTNSAAKRRQKNDHEHAKTLAAERIHADTVAALRAQRAVLYTEVYDPLRDYADYTRTLWHSRNEVPETYRTRREREGHLALQNRWERDLHARAQADLDAYDALRARVELLAPQPVRSAYAALREPLEQWVHTTITLVELSESQPTDVNDPVLGTWPYFWEGYVMTQCAHGETYRKNLDNLIRRMREDMASPTLDT